MCSCNREKKQTIVHGVNMHYMQFTAMTFIVIDTPKHCTVECNAQHATVQHHSHTTSALLIKGHVCFLFHCQNLYRWHTIYLKNNVQMFINLITLQQGNVSSPCFKITYWCYFESPWSCAHFCWHQLPVVTATSCFRSFPETCAMGNILKDLLIHCGALRAHL